MRVINENLKKSQRVLVPIAEIVVFFALAYLISKNMNKKKAPNFILVIIAAIVGSALFKQINFETLTVQKSALAAIYLIVFLIVVFLLVKNLRNFTKNN